MNWITKALAEELIQLYGSPLYVYNEDLIRDKARSLKEAISYSNKKIIYACKANSNLAVMRTLMEEGLHLDVVSPWEVLTGYRAGFTKDKILYTGNNPSIEDIDFCIKEGLYINVGSLSLLEKLGRNNSVKGISIRINPNTGAGHHDHVITGGPKSKFGIYVDQLEEARSLAKKYNIKITGLHQHIGSGILTVDKFIEAMDIMLKNAYSFPDLDIIDFGGGIGVPYKASDNNLDVKALGQEISKHIEEFSRQYGRHVTLALEPGRFFIAEAGTLLVTSNNRKRTPAYTFVGTDSGFNHLIRPMAYGSFHQINNLSNGNGNREKVVVAGNLCESGDVFTQGDDGIEDREIGFVNEGDILEIENAGAYGFAMSSNYNMRPRPAEVMVSEGLSKHKLVRRRETFEDLMSTSIL